MTETELRRKTFMMMQDTQYALQVVYDSLNSGQRKKLLKDPQVLQIFERYGVEM